MKLAILKIILWPKAGNLEPRIIEFKEDAVNIISGESATGKSSLTAIIDYCLGASKCGIPVGLIREVTGWFGLHLRLANTEMIVARQEPGEQQSNSALYWVEGFDLEIPRAIEKNARLDDLKSRFNQIAQLPYLEINADDSFGYGSRPSFRDMAAFNFQPQHIVANPHTLFFKADTTEHRERLRALFPFVLGAVDAETLAQQRELKELSREYDRLKRELDARLRAAKAWEAEIESYYMHAKALGLLPNSPEADSTWNLDRYLLELQKVPALVREEGIPERLAGTGEKAVAELTELVDMEDRLAQQIGSIRQRLAKLDQLSDSVGDYSKTLTNQKDRVHGIGWLEQKLKKSHECPLCSTLHDQRNEALSEAIEMANQLQKLSETVSQAPPKLEKELADLRAKLRDTEVQISKITHKRKFVENKTREAAGKRQKISEMYLFAGRVEQALDNVSKSSNAGDTDNQVKKLDERIRALKALLDPDSQKRRLHAAIDSVSTRIAEYARLLQLEHATENVKLDVRELSLTFSPLSGRKDFLWELGSGQNWVGYHIASLLALHEHFFTNESGPIPRFLMFDQPSQVYFPDAWPSVKSINGKKGDDYKSADIAGVKRIFATLSNFLTMLPEPFQVIVTEHAGEITWAGLDNIHLVGNWREGEDDFLIPRSWFQ